MPYQTNANILVAIKRESTFGVAPSAGSATRIRLNGSGGLELKRSPIQSQEKRADALNTMGRLGGKSVEGSYNCEFAVGGETDILIEAIMRASYVAAVAITQATMTSITTTATTIVAAAGSWITQGVRVGDIVVLTGHSTAANNNINLRVTAVSTLTLTLAGTAPLVLDATPDTTFTLTIQKKVINGDAPIRFSHTIEQYDQDTDLSELFLGCRLVGMKLSCKPNGMVMVVYTFMGVDRTALTTGTSPFYTTPALSTGLKLIADDSAISLRPVESAGVV